MISSGRVTRSSLLSTTILIVVVACLCFSVGEGLRLTPFPVSSTADFTNNDAALNVTKRTEPSVRKYGPLNVPTQNQKRGKRQLADFGAVTSQTNHELPLHLVNLADAGNPVCIVSNLFGALLPGRAPPVIS